MLRRILRLDWILSVTTLLLLGVGLLALYGISSAGWQGGGFFVRQSVFAVIGLGILAVFVFADYRHIVRLSTPVYFVTLGSLFVVLVFGATARGTSGWLRVGMVQFQPVEAAKLALIVFLASFIVRKGTELSALVRLVASLILTGVMVGFVFLQPDLGSALVLLAIWLGMVVASGIRPLHFLVLAMLGLSVILGSWSFLAPYQKERIVNVFEPQSDPQGSGYNVLQAMVAIGSGGLTGKGIGHGSQSQLNFLPEKHTDFIFAAVTEEMGLSGALFVVALYGVLLYRVWRIAVASQDNFGYLVSSGVLVMLATQFVVNVGMNVGLLPVTGITLPLVSYGGSSIVATLASLGLVLNVGLKNRELTLGKL